VHDDSIILMMNRRLKWVRLETYKVLDIYSLPLGIFFFPLGSSPPRGVSKKNKKHSARAWWCCLFSLVFTAVSSLGILSNKNGLVPLCELLARP